MREEKTLGEIAYETWCYDISHDAWQAVADAVIAEYEARRWRSIESAPKDGTVIDLWCVNDKYSRTDEGARRLSVRFADCAWSEDDKAWQFVVDDGMHMLLTVKTDECSEGWTPTHWTPIPAPPQEASNGA